MKCTKCGELLIGAVCNSCLSNHKPLLYKLADECQTRREYDEALKYYELIKNSTDNQDELNDINKTIAKIGFSLTDLTGKELQHEKIRDFFSNYSNLSLSILVLIGLFFFIVKVMWV